MRSVRNSSTPEALVEEGVCEAEQLEGWIGASKLGEGHCSAGSRVCDAVKKEINLVVNTNKAEPVGEMAVRDPQAKAYGVAAGRLGRINLLWKIIEVALSSWLESPISEHRLRNASADSLTFWLRISSISVKPLEQVNREKGVKVKLPLGTASAEDKDKAGNGEELAATSDPD